MIWRLNTNHPVLPHEIGKALRSLPVPSLPITAFTYVNAAIDAASVQAKAFPSDARLHVSVFGEYYDDTDPRVQGKTGCTIDVTVQEAAQGEDMYTPIDREENHV